MKNCQSCGELLKKQNLCWCGFDNTSKKQIRCTANEEFIFLNTKTSHKRFESMVVYALHFALRDNTGLDPKKGQRFPSSLCSMLVLSSWHYVLTTVAQTYFSMGALLEHSTLK